MPLRSRGLGRNTPPLVLAARALGAVSVTILGAAIAGPQHHGAILVETASEVLRRAAIDEHEPVGDEPEQMTVMADHHDSAAEAGERLDQRLARLHVEMIGRLVKDQDMRRVSRDEGERKPRPFATRK